MRTLATIQKILDIKPIEGADAIEVATILGWHVVVKKGEFKVGDIVVYFEVDSLLPIRPEFAFLQKNGIRNMLVDGQTVSGYRIKTVKLRGQISQGIVFPLTILPESFGRAFMTEGTDITELLGVYKYELPLPAELAGKVRGNFPGFLPKTDETRLQAYPQVLEKYKDYPFYVTEKIDGSSCTFVVKDDTFHVCSRNLDLLDDGKNTLWRLAKEMELEKKLKDANLTQLALQGEVFGEGIQGNPLKINGQKILFFNAYNYIEGKYLDYLDFRNIIEKVLLLQAVPFLGDDWHLLDSVDKMVEHATRKSRINPNVDAEGVVWRPLNEAKDDMLGRLSFKVINPEYLLKHE